MSHESTDIKDGIDRFVQPAQATLMQSTFPTRKDLSAVLSAVKQKVCFSVVSQ